MPHGSLRLGQSARQRGGPHGLGHLQGSFPRPSVSEVAASVASNAVGRSLESDWLVLASALRCPSCAAAGALLSLSGRLFSDL